MLQKVFDNNLVAICKSRITLTLHTPAYIGMCILYLSKVLMYKFRYDYIRNKYGNNPKLFFTDTDSLIHEIKIKDVYENFSKDKQIFNISNDSVESN